MRGLLIGLALLASGCASAVPEQAPTPAVASQGAAAQAATPSLNAYRAANGLSGLSRSAALQRAAESHARDMERMGDMTHTGSDGSSVGDRVKQQGYRFRRVAENIAETGRGADRVMELWIASAPHRKNMLLPDVTQYGLAQSGDYWALVVGRPR
ncbi:CAP domain-containing protein [Salipiger abyssi]|uniref:CAP domain-containing protein n=1 Tax=Salipiger abyssi TaxID=1250539 RepID=UPI001F18A73D|nr:CAP domain-containing protein [Salipiger abyssi]